MRMPVNDNLPPLGPGTVVYSFGRFGPSTFAVTRTSIDAGSNVRRFPLMMQPHPACDYLSSRLAPSPPPPKPGLHIV